MKNMQSQAIQDSLAEKDKQIAELNDLLQKSKDDFNRALQKNINYYENILALMPGHVYWLDRNNVYLGCNDNQAQQFMLASRHEIVGKKNSDLLYLKNQAVVVDNINTRVIETGIAYTGIDHANLADGEGIYFSQKVPLRDDQNDVIGLLGISIDITALKKTEVALMEAKESAEAANRAKIDFIANMSHDIRTPLSGVVGMSQLLKERLTEPEHRQFADWINQSGGQLLSLLNDIMDVVSAGNMRETDIKSEVFDLRKCVYDIVQLERPTTMLKKIELNVNIDEALPRYIKMDRAKLHRVLLNLLGNAIKFTQTGSITIGITVKNHANGNKSVQFDVTDTGIGIPLEHQTKVFDRFFRGNSSYHGTYSGNGVGLHIAQSFVNLLGGELKFTSQPNRGTTFYFELPLNVDQCLDEAVIQGAAPPFIYDNTSLEEDNVVTNQPALHLLLVEDNEIALRMVELIAAQAGCQYTSALNGEDALALVKTMDFHLIITDIGLPGISGYDLTHQIRQWEIEQQKQPIAVVGLTAHAHAKNQCLQSGMNEVFCKPLNLQMMKSILLKFGSTISHFDFSTEKQKNGLPKLDSQFFELDQFILIDYQHATQRIGEKRVLNEMLHLMATQEIPRDIKLLQAAYEIQDWDAIEKMAHKMKGGAVYCGTFKMQYACQYLERYHKSGGTELLDKLYHQLLQVLEETKQAINNLNFN